MGVGNRVCRPIADAFEAYLGLASLYPGRLLFAWVSVPIFFIAVGLLVAGAPTLDTDISSGSYLRSDGDVSDRYDALRHAVNEERRRKASSGLGRRLSNSAPFGETAKEAYSAIFEKEDLLAEDGRPSRRGRRLVGLPVEPERLFAEWKVDLYYEAREGSIFDPEVLNDIRRLERAIESLPSYSEFCLARAGTDPSCRGLISAMLFFHGIRHTASPRGQREQHVAYYIYPDGGQEERHPVAPVLTAMAEPGAWQTLTGKFGRLWYFDPGFPDCRRMRSRLWFGTPLPGFNNHQEAREKQYERYRKFVADELYPALREAGTERLKVYFEGHVITEYEVVDVVVADSMLALASLACVWAYMALYTRAPLLALFGMVMVVMSLPLSGVLFLVTGHRSFPAINFLALFLLTGIGADHLFVLADAWRQSKRDSDDLKTRLQVTLRRAGKAVVACGCTTAASFLANMFSAVRPLRWFGAFVGLCVLSNLILSLGVFPLVLLLRESGKQNMALLGRAAARPPPAGPPPEVQPGLREAGRAENGAAELPEIPQTPSRFHLLRFGGGESSRQGSPADVSGKAPRLHERFCTEIFASLVSRWQLRLIFMGAALTLFSLTLVAVKLEVSKEPPAFFSPGSHNLGDIQAVRSSFGNHSHWVPDMETEPLRICRGCTWPERGPPSISPSECERLGPTCQARPCAGPHGLADPQPCGHRGVCHAASGRCKCQPGFTGPDCRQTAADESTDCSMRVGEEICNGHGICRHSMCYCDPGWWGHTCMLQDGSVRDCVWSSWATWSSCSVSCGWGLRSRRREIAIPAGVIGEACSGRSMETRECKRRDCDVDCLWGNWGSWSSCNVACGDGFQERTRSVLVEATGQGSPCLGAVVEAASCTRPACGPHCNVSGWQPLGDCSTTCGEGVQWQRRSVRLLSGAPPGSCEESDADWRAPCNEAPCPSLCRYGPWEDEGECSASCGLGRQAQVARPTAGVGCAEQRRTVDCAGLTCPSASGNTPGCDEMSLGDWQPWGRCSSVCGPAERRRSRSGPASCPSRLVEQVEACELPACTPLCESFTWMPASSCSVTCGMGRQVERRDFGFARQPSGCSREREVDCYAGIECPVDCAMGSWRWMGSCSVTCGEGMQQQVRPVVQFGAHGGIQCPIESSPLRQRSLPCDSGIACPVGSQLQLRLSGEVEVGEEEQAELKQLIAAYLGISPEDVDLGSGGGGRRLEGARGLVISVAVSSGVGEADLERLARAVENGEFHSRLRSGPGFDSLSQVELVPSSTPQPPVPSPAGPAPSPAPTPPPDPANHNLPDSEVATVSLVFGVQVGDVPGAGRESARTGGDFDFSRSATRAAIERACDNVKRLGTDLALRRARCLLEDFQIFLRMRGFARYPTWHGYSVNALMSTFLLESFGMEWQDHVGFSEDGAHVTWVRLSFVTNLPSRMPAEEAWTFAERWDRFVESYKNAEAGNGVDTVFHTSELWVRAETETKLVKTTVLSTLVSVTFALVAVVLFLGNLALAVFVTLSIMSVVACLAALMFGVIGWTFGPVEAVGLFVFVGCSVDYTMHLAEAFSQSKAETRFARTQEALQRTGGAIFAAAMTSVFAGLPILLCTIQVFVQFGVLVIVNTLLSLLFSLVFFSALLMTIGPFTDPCCLALSSCRHIVSRKERPGCPEVTIGAVVATLPGGTRAASRDVAAPRLPAASGYSWMTFDDDGAKKARPRSLSELDSASESLPGSPVASTFLGEPVVVATPTRTQPSLPGEASPDEPAGLPAQLFGRPA